MCLKNNEAVIKMIMKGRSPTMRHVSRTHRVALDWIFERINLNPKIRIKFIDTKNQLVDIVTKGNFTRDEWNLLCLFNNSHFSSINCSDVMSKRTQKDSGGERVTGKSKPMMKLVSRCSERTPDMLASTASESPGKTTRHESQLPLSSWNEQHQRAGRLVLDAYSSNYSEWNADKNWSSPEWKSDELMEVRTKRPVYEQRPGLFAQHTDKFIVDDDDLDSNTVAESDMSLKSRSFLHRVNDRVRKMLDQSSQDATQDSNIHSLIW